jgi:diguanylate cyclase (GGDEF)-like protein
MDAGLRSSTTARLLHALSDAVLVLRADVVVSASDGAEQRLGTGALVGSTLRGLVHRDDAPPSPGQPTTRVRLAVPTGGHRWFEATRVPADDGSPDGSLLAVRDIHEQVERERALVISRRRLQDALDVSLDGFSICQARRRDGEIIGFVQLEINLVGAKALDRPREEIIGRDILEVFADCRPSGLWDAMVRALETGEPVEARFERPGPNGTRLVEGVARPLDADTVLTSWRDISASARQQELLARTSEDAARVRAALEAALHATSDSFAVYELVRNAAGEVERIVVRLMNTAAARPLGHDPEAVRGRDLLEVFPDVQRCGLWEAIVASVEERRPLRHRVHTDDENGVWVASFDNTLAPLGEDQVVVTWRDVTLDEQGRRDLERTRSQAEHAASHDHLTGLPNRWRLEQRLRDALGGTAPGRRLAVVFCDLDDFKAVNDSFGHPAGDVLLQEVATRLQQLTRSDDTAARLAGDEFVLVLRDLPAGWEPGDFVRRADHVLGRPVDVGPAVVRPSASVGVVVVDPAVGGRTPETLLADADRAMYRAKRARGLRPETFRVVS